MSLIEKYANNEILKQKAKAFDEMQRQAELDGLANEMARKENEAFELGKMQTAQEMADYMRSVPRGPEAEATMKLYDDLDNNVSVTSPEELNGTLGGYLNKGN